MGNKTILEDDLLLMAISISKTFIVVALVISAGLAATVILLSHEQKQIEGKYINSDSTFSFYSDGTFVQDTHEKSKKPISLGGTYVIRGKEITIKFDLMGAAFHLQRLNGSTIMFENETWTNINDIPEPTPTPTPTPPPPLPVGIYHYDGDYMELRGDGNYTMHENLSVFTLENSDNEGEYLATVDRVTLTIYGRGKKTVYLDRISYRDFKIVNKTTLMDINQKTLWEKQ